MKTILLVEDDLSLTKLLRHVLKRFNVIAAATGEDALQAFGNRDRSVGLLVADVRLRRLSGIQVALHIRSESFDFPVVLMSGYLADGWRDMDIVDLERLGSKLVIVLQKPFATHALLNAVYDLIGKPHTEIARTA